MSELNITFDSMRNQIHFGATPQVFHCHFYNTALQRAVEEGLGNAAAPVLIDEAARVVMEQFASLGARGAGALKTASEIFRTLGFGTLKLEGLSAQGGSAEIIASHYALGWSAVYGQRETPACAFPAGFVAAATAAAFELDLATVTCREVECIACGGSTCSLKVEVA